MSLFQLYIDTAEGLANKHAAANQTVVDRHQNDAQDQDDDQHDGQKNRHPA